MQIGVLGTGLVGSAIASRLITLGHEVMMGSRTANNPKATAWASKAGGHAQSGTFADAATFGDIVFNCTHGADSVAALRAAGEKNLEAKIVVDVANILPPDNRGSESLGEQIQKAFPSSKVVKTLNTINCVLMVRPQTLAASHTLFLSGNDAHAKNTVRGLLESFGWSDILDRDQVHRHVDAPNDEDTLLGFHLTGHVRRETAVAGIDLTRLQRASKVPSIQPAAAAIT